VTGADRPGGTDGDRGAVLILALIFLTVVGLVGGALVTLAGSGLSGTSQLQIGQAQGYAAEAAVDAAMQDLRGSTAMASAPGYGGTACPTLPLAVPSGNTGGAAQQLEVVCAVASGEAGLGAPVPFERTIVFAACLQSVAPGSCLNTSTPYLPVPVTGNALVIATTLYEDLLPGCTFATTTNGCFQAGYRVNVTSWDVRSADS
jgi:hypothetical protein